MTNQEIFNRVLWHLREQGHAAMDFGGFLSRCVYRGDNGDMCAVGCLIPDEAYTPDIEGFSVEDVEWGAHGGLEEALRKSGIASRNVPLLIDLQFAHDEILDGSGMTRFESEMRAIAGRFHLKYTPPV